MPNGVGVTSLIAGTISLVVIYWRCLRRPRSHGFFRLFALEAILVTVVLNAPVWFARPFAPTQLLSWALLTISGFLAAHTYRQLRHFGRPSGPDPGSPLFRLENTGALVTTGAYRFIRHPAYASLLCLAWGAALKSLSAVSAVLALVASVFLLATAKVEEAENISRFGSAYRDYMARTKLFLPFAL